MPFFKYKETSLFNILLSNSQFIAIFNYYKIFKLLTYLIFSIIVITPTKLLNAKYQDKKKDVVQTESYSEKNKEDNNNILNTLIFLIPLISAILGGLAGASISEYYKRKQTKLEYRSLILAFCAELVTTFNRCVGYYRQASNNEVSYSALFSFTDSYALSKFSSICKKPEIVAAIIELKSMYFQIQRHVLETAKLAIEASRTSNSRTKEKFQKKALFTQGTALAFFKGFYDRIEKETELIVNATTKIAPGDVAKELEKKFYTAVENKKEIDNKKTNKKDKKNK